MTRSEPNIRTATAQDAAAFFGKAPDYSFRGYVADLEGEIVGIGGVFYYDGLAVAFSEMREPMRKHKKSIVKACRILTELFDKLGGNVYAVACPTEPTAPNLLARLGFVPSGRMCEEGELLVRS